MSWTVSNNQVSATNVSYSYSFKTATAGTIKTITFAVSGAGLAGAPTITAPTGSAPAPSRRAGQTITYTVTAAAAIPANIPIYIEFGGLTNSSTAGSYTTTITTQTAVPATIDTGTTPAVTLAANNTAVTVNLAKSLTFTVDTTAFELDMDPSLPRPRRPVGDRRADGADERQLRATRSRSPTTRPGCRAAAPATR